jgi:GntR family transcriptional regulator
MTVAVLRQDGIPLYHQLKEIFVEKIVNAEWVPGQIIPSEKDLCAQYGVSRGPMRQALNELVRAGMLTRKQGKGTWVRPPQIQLEGGLTQLRSFTELIEQRGLRHSARYLSFDGVPARGGIARSLSLAEGEPVFRACRLRLADGEPLILETLYLPEKVCPELTEADLSRAPLYTTLATQYGVPLLRARQFYEPALADDFEARVLQLPTGAPVLLVQNTTYSTDDQPVVLAKAIWRGDRVRYYVELTAPVTNT